MSDTLIVLHTAIAILAVVLLIIVVKVDPVISLVIGTLYLGIAAGLDFANTIETLVRQPKGINIDRVDRGKIAEHWGEADTVGMLMQMGVDPFAGRMEE